MGLFRRRRRRRGGFFSRIFRRRRRRGGSTAAVVAQTVGASSNQRGEPTDQDMICYAERYPDLKQAFGHDVGRLRQHWHQYGIKEQRNPYCDVSSTPTTGTGTKTTDLVSKNTANASLRSDPLHITKDPNRQTIAPTTVQFNTEARRKEMMTVFGSIDKEYGAFEKPPLSKVPNLDADVSWGHKDLPAVLMDWAVYTEQDEKDRTLYYKILEWVPAKENDDSDRPSRKRILSPRDWFRKFVSGNKKREQDEKSKTGPQHKKKRRVRSEDRGRNKKIRTRRRRRGGLFGLFRRRRRRRKDTSRRGKSFQIRKNRSIEASNTRRQRRRRRRRGGFFGKLFRRRRRGSNRTRRTGSNSYYRRRR